MYCTVGVLFWWMRFDTQDIYTLKIPFGYLVWNNFSSHFLFKMPSCHVVLPCDGNVLRDFGNLPSLHITIFHFHVIYNILHI